MKALTIILLLTLGSCITQKRCLDKFPPTRKQEITIEHRPVVMTVRIPGEIIALPGNPIIVTRQGDIQVDPSHLETRYAESSAWIEDNQLMHTLHQRPVERDTILTETTITDTIEKETITNILKPWQKIMIAAGILSILVTMALTLRHLIKKFFKDTHI